MTILIVMENDKPDILGIKPINYLQAETVIGRKNENLDNMWLHNAVARKRPCPTLQMDR